MEDVVWRLTPAEQAWLGGHRAKRLAGALIDVLHGLKSVADVERDEARKAGGGGGAGTSAVGGAVGGAGAGAGAGAGGGGGASGAGVAATVSGAYVPVSPLYSPPEPSYEGEPRRPYDDGSLDPFFSAKIMPAMPAPISAWRTVVQEQWASFFTLTPQLREEYSANSYRYMADFEWFINFVMVTIYWRCFDYQMKEAAPGHWHLMELTVQQAFRSYPEIYRPFAVYVDAIHAWTETYKTIQSEAGLPCKDLFLPTYSAIMDYFARPMFPERQLAKQNYVEYLEERLKKDQAANEAFFDSLRALETDAQVVSNPVIGNGIAGIGLAMTLEMSRMPGYYFEKFVEMWALKKMQPESKRGAEAPEYLGAWLVRYFPPGRFSPATLSGFTNAVIGKRVVAIFTRLDRTNTLSAVEQYEFNTLHHDIVGELKKQLAGVVGIALKTKDKEMQDRVQSRRDNVRKVLSEKDAKDARSKAKLQRSQTQKQEMRDLKRRLGSTTIAGAGAGAGAGSAGVLHTNFFGAPVPAPVSAAAWPTFTMESLFAPPPVLPLFTPPPLSLPSLLPPPGSLGLGHSRARSDSDGMDEHDSDDSDGSDGDSSDSDDSDSEDEEDHWVDDFPTWVRTSGYEIAVQEAPVKQVTTADLFSAAAREGFMAGAGSAGAGSAGAGSAGAGSAGAGAGAGSAGAGSAADAGDAGDAGGVFRERDEALPSGFFASKQLSTNDSLHRLLPLLVEYNSALEQCIGVLITLQVPSPHAHPVRYDNYSMKGRSRALPASMYVGKAIREVPVFPELDTTTARLESFFSTTNVRDEAKKPEVWHRMAGSYFAFFGIILNDTIAKLEMVHQMTLQSLPKPEEPRALNNLFVIFREFLGISDTSYFPVKVRKTGSTEKVYKFPVSMHRYQTAIIIPKGFAVEIPPRRIRLIHLHQIREGKMTPALSDPNWDKSELLDEIELRMLHEINEWLTREELFVTERFLLNYTFIAPSTWNSADFLFEVDAHTAKVK